MTANARSHPCRRPRVASYAIALAIAASAPAAATPAYTIADVKACSSDAIHLCSDKLNDLDAVEVCMRANYDRLRPACKARFDRKQ